MTLRILADYVSDGPIRWLRCRDHGLAEPVVEAGLGESGVVAGHLGDITLLGDRNPAEHLDTLRCQHSLLLGQRRQRHPALPPEMIVG